ncbi:MAG: hypothetical protein ACHQUC_02170 [Chlamydiales bacterium]
MVQTSIFKTQIALSDYSYRRDIEHRVLISHLTVFEVEVLKEILHETLIIPIDQLAQNLEVEQSKLLPILDSLSRIKLFKRKDQTLIVDKELRKYYESQMEKFETDFEPNLEFLQSLLSKVPVHALLVWYPIQRSSNNIFSSIIEQCLFTPKIYRQYLYELEFEDPILHFIKEDLYLSPDYKLCSKQIIAKYQLTREKFEEYLLLLEYHLVCCLTYNKIGDEWVEVVSPFSEWLEYLQFEANARPKKIQDQKSIKSPCSNEFGFLDDLTTIIKAWQKQASPIKQVKKLNLSDEIQFKALESKLNQLGYVKKGSKGASVVPTEKGLIWATKPLQDKISSMAVDPLNLISGFEDSPLWSVRNVRLIEKCLRSLKPLEWVYLDDFLKGVSAAIGDKEPIQLKKRGKKWKYSIPEYDANELEFIRKVIMERCFELGIVMIGQQKGRACLYLTPSGHQFIH